MNMTVVSMVLNFLQAIAWPTVTIYVFLFFAPVLKRILISLNKAVSQRGIKVTKTGVEIPGPPQGEMETIRDLIMHQRDWGELSKQYEPERVHEQLMVQSSVSEPVLKQHEKNLVGEIRSSLEDFLIEKIDETYDREELLRDLLCDAYICLYFERCFQRILGSQLALLKKLDGAQDHQCPQREVLQIFYDHYPHLDFSSHEKWLQYLEGLQFVHKVDSFVTLTREGKEFVRYVDERGYSLSRPG